MYIQQIVKFTFIVLLPIKCISQDASNHLLANAPVSTATNSVNHLSVEVRYHSPTVREEQAIWGKSIAYLQEWPEDKNMAMQITFTQGVRIGYNASDQLEAGIYNMTIIPKKDVWEFHFKNKNNELLLTYQNKIWPIDFEKRFLVYLEEPDPPNGMLIMQIKWGFRSGSVFIYPEE